MSDGRIENILDDVGASAFLSTPEKKELYGKVFVRHILVDSTRYLLDELKKGLQTLSVLDAMKAHPEQFRDVFTRENIAPLDAQMVDLVFRIDYVDQGSHARQKQGMASLLEGLPTRL